MVDKPPSILVAKGNLLTPDTLTARDSSSDLGIIPDIASLQADSSVENGACSKHPLPLKMARGRNIRDW